MIPQPNSSYNPVYTPLQSLPKVAQQTDEQTRKPKIKYQDKRGYIFDWIQKYSQKLKLSREACGTAQMCTDELYRNIEYDSKNAKRNLIVMLMIASKITDRLILLPKTLSYIFSIPQIDIQKQEELIFQLINHICLERSYPALVNFYLYQWGNRLRISFFDDNQFSYFIFRSIHFYAEAIFREEWKLDPENIFQIMFFVLRDKCEVQNLKMELIKVLGNKQKQENSYEEKMEKYGEEWKKSSERIRETYLKKRDFKNYNEFLCRYFK